MQVIFFEKFCLKAGISSTLTFNDPIDTKWLMLNRECYLII